MNLSDAILDFGVRLYGGSELSNHLPKCLLRMRKTQNNESWSKFFLCRMKVSESQSHATWGRIYFLTCQNFGLLKASNEIEEWTDMTSFPPKSGRNIVHFEFETAHQIELSGGVSFASQRPLSCHWSAAITQSVGVFWSSAFFDTNFLFHDSFLIQQRPGKATTSPSH